jgi:hypothetical protein
MYSCSDVALCGCSWRREKGEAGRWARWPLLPLPLPLLLLGHRALQIGRLRLPPLADISHYTCSMQSQCVSARPRTQ